MRNPIQYPFVRDATFVAGVGPSIGAAFLNLTQDALGDLFGALLGRSCSLVCDEFTEALFPVGAFGGLRIFTALNGAGSLSVYPTPTATNTPDPGLGVWNVRTTQAAQAWHFQAVDPPIAQGLLDFGGSGRVKITSRAALDTAANGGFSFGFLSSVSADTVQLRAGSDEANWIFAVNATNVDTGVAVQNNTWVDLQIWRVNQTFLAYINGALVATVAGNLNLPGLARHLRSRGPSAGAGGDGFSIDYFKAIYAR